MSNPKHPIITFQLNMTPAWNEQVGPNTNPNTTRVPYPNVATSMNDQNTNVLGDTDQQLPSQTAQYQNQVCTWLPGFLAGENIEHRVTEDGQAVQIVAYGQKATYLLNTYTTGDHPLLTVISNTYASAGT